MADPRASDSGAASVPVPGARGVRVVRHTGHTRARLAHLIEEHERALASGEGVLKDGRRTAVTRVRAAGQDFAIKEFRSTGLLDLLKDRVRRRRGMRAWRAAEHLVELGVATPPLVALLERGSRSYLVTRFVGESLGLDRLLRELLVAPLEPGRIAAKRRLMRDLGRWLQLLHGLCIYHSDTSAKNVLVEEVDEVYVFHLLDLDGVSAGRTVSRRRRVKNLSQLIDPPMTLTQTDRLRVLLAYGQDLPRDERRSLVRDVARAAGRRARRRERMETRYRARAARGGAADGTATARAR